jgi:hypothetical protein
MLHTEHFPICWTKRDKETHFLSAARSVAARSKRALVPHPQNRNTNRAKLTLLRGSPKIIGH